MKAEKVSQEMDLFGRYLTLWVALCIVVGVLIGKWVPLSLSFKPI